MLCNYPSACIKNTQYINRKFIIDYIFMRLSLILFLIRKLKKKILKMVAISHPCQRMMLFLLPFGFHKNRPGTQTFLFCIVLSPPK